MKQIITLLLCIMPLLLKSQSMPLPYYSGFDNASEQMGWQLIRTGNDPSAYPWSYSASGFSAPNCISHDYNVGGTTTDTVVDWFVSPPLNFTSPGSISLKVYTAGFSPPFNDNCEVW